MAEKCIGVSCNNLCVQWASKLLKYSSEYDTCGWGATAALGKPQVYPRYGDIRGAWAQGSCDEVEFIELEFDKAVFVTAINIYETYNCGGVNRVSIRDVRGGWACVWEVATGEHIQKTRIFSPDIKLTKYKSKAVRLDIDCSVSESWVEIDAVQLVGKRYKTEAPPSSNVLGEDLAKLVNDKETSDIIFRFPKEDVVIHCHHAILSARSSKLKTIIKETAEKGVVEIKDISSTAFHGVLHYIYTGGVPSQYSSYLLVDIWRAASSFEMHGLKCFAVSMIDEKLNKSNVVDVFVKATASEPWPEDIKEICLDFMAENMASVTLTPQFKNLSLELMLEVIQKTTARMTIG